ncbi:acyl-CoA-binding domain-containing protein 3-like [Salvia miltiorrhiza]|uniref:acyl-CoA-binding domain-containing protein 3-like n=1 Tax=Salvia miltiorrhiza TaxID=226208 RepID=UPI0025AD6B53|nr:acyl-CoA-binding domain-containing protein 3-like [Salvia miltiorrhiza]
MDAVEILLLGIVGLSALVFLILDTLDPHRRSGEALKQSRGDVHHIIEESVREEGSVGGDGESESLGREETDYNNNLVNPSCEEKEDENICRERGISDDWEGVERSELDKIFGEAIVYAEAKSIGEDVKLQLYGLQKVALEGPCHGSQPMALHLSARSKWNAWQKVGNMSEEMAMEKYISILSEAIPDWNKGEDTLTNQDSQSIQGAEER